jgi:hypothetical protein
MSILILAVWPGLDAIFRRSFRFYLQYDSEGAAMELTSEIAARFTSFVLSRIRKIAATLVLNTQCAVVESRRRSWKDLARHAELFECDLPATGTPPPSSRSGLAIAPSSSASDERVALSARLVALIGRDAVELVIAVVINGDTQRRAGERLGLNHEVARERYRTAIRRLHDHLQLQQSKLVRTGP